MRFFLAVASASCLLAVTPGPGFACSCAGTPTPSEALEMHVFVFAGTAVEIEEIEQTLDIGEGIILEQQLTRFQVDRSWKGIDGVETTVLTDVKGGGNCGYTFVQGSYYLVYGYTGRNHHDGEDETIYKLTDFCMRTKPISKGGEEMAESTRRRPCRRASGVESRRFSRGPSPPDLL